MPTKREARQSDRLDAYMKLKRDLDKVRRELEEKEEIDRRHRTGQIMLPDRQKEYRAKRIKELREEVDKLEFDMNKLVEESPTEYDVGGEAGEPGYAAPPGAASGESETGYDIGERPPAEAAPAKSQEAETGVGPSAPGGITGARGTSPGGDYDINIGIGEKGEIIAPQGLSPEQLAVMVPGAFGAAEAGDVKAAAERPSMPTAPPGQRPPDGYRVADYSPRGRENFQQRVFDEIGLNPFTFNPMDHVNQSMRELPNLFNYVFRGKIMWADRNKLNKKQMGIWQDAVKTFRAAKLKEAQALGTRALKIYNFSMNNFDKRAAVYNENLKAMRAAPKTMSFWDPEKGAMIMHEYKDGQWVPSEKITSEPKERVTKEEKAAEREYKDAWAVVKGFATSFGEDIGEAPETDNEATAKLQQIMSLFGEGKQIDERMRPVYEKALKVIQQRWGVGIGEEAPAAGGSAGTTGNVIRYDKSGKRIQ